MSETTNKRRFDPWAKERKYRPRTRPTLRSLVTKEVGRTREERRRRTQEALRKKTDDK